MKIFSLIVVLMLMCLLLSTNAGKRVNCRKYIYAPICRGVAAKRAVPRSITSLDEEKRDNQPYYAEFGIVTLLSDRSKQWDFKRNKMMEALKKIPNENVDYVNDAYVVK